MGLTDTIVDALKKLLKKLFEPITTVIEENASEVLAIVVGTPNPDSVFTKPTNGAWPALYDYYWDSIVPLALLLWALSIGLVILLESMSHLFSTYHRSKLKRRAVSGLLGILAWWWIAAFSLRFVNALAGFLLPDLSDVTLFETLSFGTMGVLGLVIALFTDLLLFVLIGLIYLGRQLALYMLVLLMPVLIALWVPGVGPFAAPARFMERLAGFFAPFLFMTVPVALLFRLGDLLGNSFGFSADGIGAWLTALVIPFFAVLSPLVLFWQAGHLFKTGSRLSRHTSRDRASDRVDRTRTTASAAHLGTQNFARGVRGQQAVTPDGQYVFDSGDSRSHAAGSRLHQAGAGLSRSFSLGSAVASPHDPGRSQSATRQDSGPSDDFEHLRDQRALPSMIDSEHTHDKPK